MRVVYKSKNSIIHFTFVIFSVSLFIACAPESKYLGGLGAFKGYESADAYRNKDIKYNHDYNKMPKSSFSSSLVANDRDNVKQTSQHVSNNKGYEKSPTKTNSINSSIRSSNYESPVQGNGSFKPTKSLLDGMRDSEAIQRATMKPYTVRGKTYRPHPVKVGDSFDGIASWYGPDFHARATSNGETYNMHAHTAANKTLPMNTIVKVYNKDNGKITYVRINDRGPFVEGRIIDLSNVAAKDIEMVGKGIANVRIEVVGFGGNLQNNTPPKDSNTAKTQSVNKNTENTQYKNNRINNSTNNENYTISKQEHRQDLNNKPDDKPYDNSSYAVLTSKPTNSYNEISNKQNYANNVKEQGKMQSNTRTNDLYNDSNGVAQDKSKFMQNESTDKQNMPNDTNDTKIDSKESSDNSESLIATVEELPPFLDDKPKQIKSEVKDKKETKDNNKTKQDEYMLKETPRYIDSEDSMRNLDDAVQKLRDSTNNISKNTQNDIKNALDSIPSNNEQQKQPIEVEKEQPKHDSNPQEIKQNIGKFMVSLNVFSSMDRAQHFKQESSAMIKDKPYTIDIVSTSQGLYRVALRGFKTHDEAKEFITHNSITGHVVEEGK